MPEFRPFKAFRPKQEFAQKVVAKPYDVLNSEEAREEVKGNPLSFLHVEINSFQRSSLVLIHVLYYINIKPI